MDDFMSLIQWINGEPFAVGLHRKKFLAGGFENLADIERQALQYEADWHSKFGLGSGGQYFMRFQEGGVVSLDNGMFDVRNVLTKAISNLGYVPDFIKRSLDKNTPSLEIDGQPATVRMMQQDNYAFPSIFPLNTPMGRVLTELPPEQAMQRAFKEGEYLEFNTEQEADFFAKNFTNIIPGR
jgi:hypothetical protein